MKRYSVRFCSCGHIHLMPMEYLSWIQEDANNRSIIQVCQSCGATYETWLGSYDDGFMVCGTDKSNFEVSENSPTKILFSKGIRVPIIDSEGRIFDATSHFGNSWYAEDWENNYFCGEVDTNTLIDRVSSAFKEDADDILRSIAGYVSGINWSGTKYNVK